MKYSLKKNKFFLWVVGAILLIVLLNVFQKEVRNFFYWFSSPIQKIFWQAGDKTSDFFEAAWNLSCLKNQTEKLEEEKQGLLVKIAELKKMEEENQFLRKALEIELQRDYDLALSQVISKDISQDYILISKGSKDGITQNMPVITEQKVLVGKVIETYPSYSKVMLIFNKEMSFDVKIEKEEKEIEAIAKGNGNSTIYLNLIPQEERLNRGEVVVTSGLGGVFPASILVGTIKEFQKSDVDFFQTAQIENSLEVSELKNVFVILDF